MPLIIEDRVADDFNRARWRARDSLSNNNVAVSVSFEALEDRGPVACLRMAEDKYDDLGNPVDVTMADF